MTRTNAACATSLKRSLAFALCLIGLSIQPAAADWKAPWENAERALVIDAYEFNPVDWEKMTADDRIAGFINKASDGMPPKYRCGSKRDDAWKLCKNRWWKYSVTKELFMTRRQMADSLGLLWGAYHMARPGNPRAQADHFLQFAEPRENDLIALDLEDLSDEFMSLGDAEIFADQIKIRTGRYPVLYTNGNTAKYISDNRARYPILSRLPLWYARYTNDLTGKFPDETWPAYALWQFSSMHNCNSRRCPYRIDGTKDDIDVNVSHLDVEGLKAAWPFDELFHAPEQDVDPSMLVASIDEETTNAVSDVIGENLSSEDKPSEMVVAYGPMGDRPKRIDPLALLNSVAAKQPKHAKSHVLDQLKEAAKAAAAIKSAPGAIAAGEPAPGMPVPKPNPLRIKLAKGSGAATVTGVSDRQDETATSQTSALDADDSVDADDPGAADAGGTGALKSVGKAAHNFFGPALPDDWAVGALEPAEETEDEDKAAAVGSGDAYASLVAFSAADTRIREAFRLTN